MDGPIVVSAIDGPTADTELVKVTWPDFRTEILLRRTYDVTRHVDELERG